MILLKTQNKITKMFQLSLLITILILAFAPNASAQEQATVITSTTTGGTTSPVPGTYNYDEDSVITLRAIPDEGFEFLHWIITGGFTIGHGQIPLIIPNPEEPFPPTRPPPTSTYDSLVAEQNPLFVVCGSGYTFQYNAVFITAQPADRNEAVVIVDGTVGGSTNPIPGTYTYMEGSGVTLTATPDEGYDFLAWRATGSGIPGHEETIIMDNPLDVICGIGYTYEYLPIFTQTDIDLDSDGVSIEIFYAIVIILAIITLVAIAAALMYRSKNK